MLGKENKRIGIFWWWLIQTRCNPGKLVVFTNGLVHTLLFVSWTKRIRKWHFALSTWYKVLTQPRYLYVGFTYVCNCYLFLVHWTVKYFNSCLQFKVPFSIISTVHKHNEFIQTARSVCLSGIVRKMYLHISLSFRSNKSNKNPITIT